MHRNSDPLLLGSDTGTIDAAYVVLGPDPIPSALARGSAHVGKPADWSDSARGALYLATTTVMSSSGLGHQPSTSLRIRSRITSDGACWEDSMVEHSRSRPNCSRWQLRASVTPSLYSTRMSPSS